MTDLNSLPRKRNSCTAHTQFSIIARTQLIISLSVSTAIITISKTRKVHDAVKENDESLCTQKQCNVLVLY